MTENESPSAGAKQASSNIAAGRFIVIRNGQRTTGLAHHQVVALIESSDGADLTIYHIHRVDEAGRLELVGVEPAELTATSVFVLSFGSVQDARRQYDRLEEAARRAPPPCRVGLQLRRVQEAGASHQVGLACPAVCADSILHWLQAAGVEAADLSQLDSDAHAAHGSTAEPVVRQVELETDLLST